MSAKTLKEKVFRKLRAHGIQQNSGNIYDYEEAKTLYRHGIFTPKWDKIHRLIVKYVGI